MTERWLQKRIDASVAPLTIVSLASSALTHATAPVWPVYTVDASITHVSLFESLPSPPPPLSWPTSCCISGST